MKALSQEWKSTETTERVSSRAERIPRRAPQWSTSTEITRRGDADSRNARLGRARAGLVTLNARFKGDKKLLHASRDNMSLELARSACKCKSRICSSCACVTRMRSCGVECECHGFCCNSVFHTPKLCIRSGALGEELYTKADLPKGKLAFVICGRVMMVPEFWRSLESVNRHCVGMRHYGFSVSWLGLVKYVVDPFDDMTGAVNHSCEPSVIVEAYWANGKIYAVGRTRRNVIAREALTVDYKWKGSTNPKEFAELCRCRESVCRGLIAEKGSKFGEVSTVHYESEIARLQAQHAEAERALQEQYKALSVLEQAGSEDDVADLEMELIRRENENAKLKAHIETMVAAVTRSRASISDASSMTTYVVEIPQVSKNQASPLRKLMRRIRSLFSSRKQAMLKAPKTDELQAEITISSATNPCFAPDSQHVVTEKLSTTTAWSPRSCPSSARGHPPPPLPRFGLRYLKGEIDHAVKTNVDAHISGTPLLSIPSAEINHAMAQRECDCYVRGRETCSGACACRASMKVCAVTCNCHGFCCNSLVTMPKLDVRGGALGQELYTKDDLPQQKVAFVVCGQILTEALFRDIALIDPRRFYYGVRVSWPGFTKDVPGKPGEVKFVVDPWSHFSGRVNHSFTYPEVQADDSLWLMQLGGRQGICCG